MKNNHSPRFLAVKIYQDMIGHSSAEDVWHRHMDGANLSEQDVGFIDFLVSHTLRYKGFIQFCLKQYIERPLKQNQQFAACCLEMGVMQILFSDSPIYAITNEMVGVVKQDPPCAYLHGLVNAVLKKVNADKEKLLAIDKIPHVWPKWLWNSWVADYGIDVAKKIAAALLVKPTVDLSVKNNPEAIAEKLDAVLLPNGSIRLKDGFSENIYGYQEGLWWVQNMAAALPLSLVGDLNGKRVLDLCAAPGGKTMQLAAMGAIVTAVDMNAARLKIMEKNLARTGLQKNVSVVCKEAQQLPLNQFDVVVVDAPCSATGTLRKNPDLAWNKSMEDVGRQTKLQTEILKHAAKAVKSGGILLYMTCSLNKQEGELQIDLFLKQHFQFKRQPFSSKDVPYLPPESVTAHGDLRLMPYFLESLGGMDGFYVSRLQKATS